MNGYQNITAFHFFFVLLRFIFLHSHADQLMIGALMQSRSPVQLIYVSTLEFTLDRLPEQPPRYQAAATAIDHFLVGYGLKLPTFLRPGQFHRHATALFGRRLEGCLNDSRLQWPPTAHLLSFCGRGTGASSKVRRARDK
jgi:hypothetical protein